MSSQTRREQKKRESEMNFFSVKASFVAGVVLIITMFKDVAELFITIPPLIVAGYLSICLLLTGFILGTHIFDKKLKSKAISNFGSFLTVGSLIIFVLENSVLRYLSIAPKIQAIIITVPLVATIIASSVFLLFHKN